MVDLVLVLGDQLSPELSALQKASKSTDIVVMAEVADEASYVAHHPKKIAFLFASMRKFAAQLRADGWTVDYTRLGEGSDSICGVLMRAAEEYDANRVLATEPGEWRLIEALRHCPVTVEQLPDDRFIASHKEFEGWAEGRKALRMEYFYREMRRKTGLMMDGDTPAGGQWNYDEDNRKPPPEGIDFAGPMRFTPDETVEEVLQLVERRFGNSFGDLRPFWFATDRGQARQHLAHWVKKGLPDFGTYQDAMMDDERFMYHSIVGLYINAGLLNPMEVCEAVEKAWQDGDVPINAAEGFIRQIIGWREYIRGIYFREGPDYIHRNGLDHTRDLPGLYWGDATDMRCMSRAIEQTKEEAYAHHIQRLMVTGNFALLAGIDPFQVHEWYLRVYADAYEWVEAPNVIGMSQFADGGIIASKPYVSSGNYIHKMSDYCGSCAYSVTKKTGKGACPFNLLYWHFMDRHREKFASNNRIGRIYGTWDRMDDAKKETILSEAQAFLDRMDAGETV
ncbi:cryptochrome/photolyase family protein [Loktanella sp. TSTF-M6]|uniref:Cryptochrome/photolyase family protein n=1 Tax=Loktanella gaetbuli TaxID=2881335 RepID=A0ABS8BSS2_9RHOB|nr:cryptochrome/photolyase family protein [Loktanella gaetbuli]MCB5198761.1 cryptochrome/photolyase family protein [Loktanella gaetbuli]